MTSYAAPQTNAQRRSSAITHIIVYRYNLAHHPRELEWKRYTTGQLEKIRAEHANELHLRRAENEAK